MAIAVNSIRTRKVPVLSPCVFPASKFRALRRRLTGGLIRLEVRAHAEQISGRV
jgi:hypothetical protein